ncbi:MAG TPA: hypothetical protein PLP27_04025 [Crocinitomicaceae bacterium]|nr:hypothetical protein [Crocinitomicaceae bacterium]
MINLFVSKLDYGVTQDDLMNLFKPYGFVKKVSVITDKETGKSKGFAFIEINSNDVQAMLDELDGYNLNGRSNSVKIAEDKGSRPAPRPYDNNRGERKPFDNNRFSRPQRTETQGEYKKTNEPKVNAQTISSPEDLVAKNERAKKGKDKKGFSSGTSDGPKKGKMQAYKKSGKSNRFFTDDDDDGDFEFEY